MAHACLAVHPYYLLLRALVLIMRISSLLCSLFLTGTIIALSCQSLDNAPWLGELTTVTCYVTFILVMIVLLLGTLLWLHCHYKSFVSSTHRFIYDILTHRRVQHVVARLMMS